MEVKKFEDGILFGEKIFFTTSGKLLEDKINLLPSKGEDIRKNKLKEFIVDYPGEYEKYNIYIQVFKGDTDRLNFFIQDYDLGESFAFIQDPSVLENLELTKYPQKWYYTDDIVFNQIERLGFEGETFKL